MVDKERRKFLGAAASAGATSLSGCLADIVLKEEDRKRRFGDDNREKPERTPNGDVEVLNGIDNSFFQAWVNKAEQHHQSYEDHEDVYEEIKAELGRTDPYVIEFEDYLSENHVDGRGVMVTEDVILATPENQYIGREVDGDHKEYVLADRVNPVQVEFSDLEELLREDGLPGSVNVNDLRSYMNDFGKIAPFVPNTSYDEPNFSDEIIDEFVRQTEDIDEYIDKYQNLLTGGTINDIRLEGVSEVLNNADRLKTDIENTPTEQISNDEYQHNQDEYIELSEVEELLDGGGRYRGVESTFKETKNLYERAARELGALVVLSEVYDVAVEEMEKGADIYDEGDYDRTGKPKERDSPHDSGPEAPRDDGGDGRDYEPPADNTPDNQVTEPTYQKDCAKIKNWDLDEMQEDFTYDQRRELMAPVMEDVYGDGYNVNVFFDGSFEDPGETGIIFLHYEENEAGGDIRNAQIGYRMINEDGVSVPSEGEGSRFGPPVYGPYDIDDDLAAQALEYTTVDMDCREY